MAGHSKFKNIMHRKGAQDRIRAKLFSRLGKEISIAVKIGGASTETNIRLRSAIATAKGANMPKDNILRAIKKGQGNDTNSNYEEVRYEGYGPAGTAIIVDALTNNKNRTASEIRTLFSKNGGSLGESGSVIYNFERFGNILIGKQVSTEEKIFNFVVENGSIDMEINTDNYSIFCKVEDVHILADKITEHFGIPVSSQLIWKSNINVNINLENAKILFDLIGALEENDDVQSVSSNFEISEEIVNQSTG